MKTLALLVFVCGAFYEASCVGFVHFSGAGSPWRTAAMSMLAGAAEVTGIFGSVHDWHVGPFFVLGLGTGAFLGVTAKRRRSMATPKTLAVLAFLSALALSGCGTFLDPACHAGTPAELPCKCHAATNSMCRPGAGMR